MPTEDFIKFLTDLDYYLPQDLQEWVDDTVDYHAGIIRGRTPQDDVRVNLCITPPLPPVGKSGIPVKSALIPITCM